MKLGLQILFSITLTVNSYSQKCDLERSSHEFIYNGDSVELKNVVKLLQSESIGLISEKQDICELEIIKIGTTSTKQFNIYYIDWAFGISCRGGFATVFYQNEKYIGYYYSDIASPIEIRDNALIWKTEGGTAFEMDLSKEIPESYLFIGFERNLIKN